MAEIGEKLTAEQAMRLAIQEAVKGVGFVAPNPLVGCVILDKSDRLLAVGYHRQVGFDHAEADALKKVVDKRALEGATVFVTLEPCAHEGRTPSCAKALAALPIGTVVYGIQDPNPLVAGQGAQILRAAGIKALELKDLETISAKTLVALTTELEELAEIFLRNMREKKPFVSLKVATSLDGVMAMSSGESKWITSEESRHHSHWLRAHHDAVLIGRNTFVTDKPQLNVRLPGFEKFRNKVILLDPAGKSLSEMKGSSLLSARGPEDVWVVVAEGVNVENPSGVHLVEVKADASGTLLPDGILAALWDRQLKSIFIEGGAQTFSHFLSKGEVQRLHLFLAPSLIGGRHGLSWTRYFGNAEMKERVPLRGLRLKTIGPDIYVTGRL